MRRGTWSDVSREVNAIFQPPILSQPKTRVFGGALVLFNYLLKLQTTSFRRGGTTNSFACGFRSITSIPGASERVQAHVLRRPLHAVYTSRTAMGMMFQFLPTPSASSRTSAAPKSGRKTQLTELEIPTQTQQHHRKAHIPFPTAHTKGNP